MKKRIVIAVAVVLSLGIAMAVLLGWHSRKAMPVYQGKTARQWLGEINTLNQLQAFDAFRQMGPAAVQFLVRELEHKDSAWDRFYQRNYLKLPAAIRAHLSPPLTELDRWNAAEMMAVNVNAKAAVPDFTRVLATRNGQQQFCALVALINFIGPDDTNSVSALIKCLQSPNVAVPPLAAVGLERIGPGAQAAVPALTAVLEGRNPDGTFQNSPFELRMEAARALWTIDHQTNAPAKVFREALGFSDVQVRCRALFYLVEIQPDDVSLIAPMAKLLHDGDNVWQMLAAENIGRYGPAAKEAVPDLVKLAGSSNVELRRRARQSLKMIDPEAAAKFEH